jgi:hypothetical protein
MALRIWKIDLENMHPTNTGKNIETSIRAHSTCMCVGTNVASERPTACSIGLVAMPMSGLTYTVPDFSAPFTPLARKRQNKRQLFQQASTCCLITTVRRLDHAEAPIRQQFPKPDPLCVSHMEGAKMTTAEEVPTTIQATHNASNPHHSDKTSQFLQRPLPKYVECGTKEEEIITVTLSPSDSAHPHRLSHPRKWAITILLCTATINMGYTSAVYSPAFSLITTSLSTSRLVATMGLSLFIAGLGAGPMFFAPLSEFYGRRPIYLVSLLLFLVWLVPCARAESIQVLLIARFLDGVSGSAFTSVAGGTVGDLFAKNELAGAMMFFTAAPL